MPKISKNEKSGAKRGQKKEQKRVQKEALAASKNQRWGSFEPDLKVPQIRMRAAEDETESNIEPLTAEEIQNDETAIAARKQMLTVAMNKESQDKQNLPFTGSVYEQTIAVAKEADKQNAAQMEKQDWVHLHEELYEKYLPYSARCYKIFRRAAEGNALQDAEFVKLLLIGRLKELRTIPQDLADQTASKYVTKQHMYKQMRADVERKREERETGVEGGQEVERKQGEEGQIRNEEEEIVLDEELLN